MPKKQSLGASVHFRTRIHREASPETQHFGNKRNTSTLLGLALNDEAAIKISHRSSGERFVGTRNHNSVSVPATNLNY